MSLLNSEKNKSMVFWLTGLSGSGKTTMANVIRDCLETKNKRVIVLDGDYIRAKINKNLGFSKSDIEKNNRMTAELVKTKVKEFDIVIVPIISPFNDHRLMVRKIIGDNFFLVYINSSLKTCIERDTKGLYQKARQGEIRDMIGYHECSPYEIPENSDLVLDTDKKSPDECLVDFKAFIKEI